MYGVEKSPQGKKLDNKNSTPGARRVLLFVTADTISEAIVYAVEKEFPWISVEQVPDIEAACGMFDATVSLIVVDTSLIDQLEERSTELANLHPSALIAMMQDSRRDMPADRILAAPAVRGILPMDMKLDIWLSIVRLLLRGGEYSHRSCSRAKQSEKRSIRLAMGKASTSRRRMDGAN